VLEKQGLKTFFQYNKWRNKWLKGQLKPKRNKLDFAKQNKVSAVHILHLK
jgi:hypothetical protein